MPEHTNDPLWGSAALEVIAAVEHERWSHWQRYLHSQCDAMPDGSLVIPAALATRWDRQMHTPYEDLSDAERASDREQAQHYLAALRNSRLEAEQSPHGEEPTLS